MAEPAGRQTRYEFADPHLTRAIEELVRVVLAIDEGAPCVYESCDVPLCCGTGTAAEEDARS